ncbi:sulfite exporter TauE/SafE family protein [Francisella sp. SYW-9]|uniref:sulfite exporter TauE/SafE family protein n=1 Tax=Francisella sp. SYW-9 TaxID=2610888 RepID=UPI00123D7CF0|nr:sulfite exporter TauE/SafE family protein [Francisella sp. SYW-9]
MISVIFCFVVIGIIVGTLAALFGFGGGVIVVPAIAMYISVYEPTYASNSMHIAVATSLLVMLFTSLKTTYAHHKANNIIWNVALKLKLGLIIGTIVGAAVASYLSSILLKILFIIFLIYTIAKLILKMISNAKSAKINESSHSINKPSSKLLYTYGLITGFVSVVLGIGGSIIIVPFLRGRNYKLTSAAAISSSIIPFLALFGAISYTLIGFGDPNLPSYCLGYVYLPVAVSIVVGSFVGVSIGVKLSRIVPNRIQDWVYLACIIVILMLMIL